jgi:enamine deaminase RidA (YjgF/YER057c/UK114 family)/quercetin dioxygenase-like cupin family protein
MYHHNEAPKSVPASSPRVNLRAGTPWETQLAYSRAVRTGNVIAIGQTSAIDPRGQIAGGADPYLQAVCALANVKDALHSLGASLKDVIRTRIYLAKFEHWEVVAKAHAEVFRDIRPACSLIQCQMIASDILVEFEADAVIAESDQLLGSTLKSIGSVVDRRTAEHYEWGAGCEGWHFLKDSGLSVIAECMAPNTSETRHCHQRATQFFYVLQGSLAIEIDGRDQLMAEGQGAHIPPGCWHQVHNRTNAPAEFLVISAPPSHGDRCV